MVDETMHCGPCHPVLHFQSSKIGYKTQTTKPLTMVHLSVHVSWMASWSTSTLTEIFTFLNLIHGDLIRVVGRKMVYPFSHGLPSINSKFLSYPALTLSTMSMVYELSYKTLVAS